MSARIVVLCIREPYGDYDGGETSLDIRLDDDSYV